MNQMKRFLEIIENNKNKNHVLAFIGLGSMHHTDRIDDYSDIDFFMIVEDGFKEQYLKSVDWLEVSPIAWWYQETNDGLKVLYEDQYFLEFAVFTQDELKHIPYEKGTVYYKKEHINDDMFIPTIQKSEKKETTYIINTWLSNLYIGLLRELRGEKVAALFMIQVYATNHMLTLLDLEDDDPFVVERRVEQKIQLDYQKLYAGYDGNITSVKYQLEVIGQRYRLPESLIKALKRLLDKGE